MLVCNFINEALEKFRSLAIHYIKEVKIKHNKSNRND